MSVRILGPLEVGDGTPVRGARERRLLALLALHAPGAVSRAVIADWLFGSAGTVDDSAVSVAVSRLRRQLSERGSGATIERTADRLRLVIAPSQLDSAVFRQLASDAFAEVDWAKRARRLREALGLWRGELLDGEDLPHDPMLTALDELRLACLEQRFAAEVDLGPLDAIAVAELVSAWRAHPEREQLCRTAMVALYRAGRQLDALSLFREAQEALVERGLEPGRDLVQLEAAIVRRDPALLAPVAVTSTLVETTPAVVAAAAAQGLAPSIGATASTAGWPVELSSFVGRVEELAELSELLTRHRLVTVTGAGGVGKTRLAVRAAVAVVCDARSSVPMVELAAITDPALVPTAFAETLNVALASTRSPAEAVVDHLRTHPVPLLVVDNCEHVIDAAADLVGRLLKAVPTLRILASSREPLRVEGELVYALAPLEVTAADGGDGPAMELFVERAIETGCRLADGAATRQQVAAICTRLDGLPLAIELAAARARTLSLDELHDRLDHRFRLLTIGIRGAAARQRTLEATVAWSYDLLDDRARALFDVASVFAGGFELDAIVSLAEGDDYEVLDGLDQLVERSLLQATQRPDRPTRFSMLETMRQFGREKLIVRGDLDDVRNRHLSWLAALAQQQSAALQLSVPAALDRIDRELANLRLALEWAAQDASRAEVGLRATLDLSRYWYQRGITAEAARWIETLNEQDPTLDDASNARLLCDLGFYLLQAGRAEDALVPLERSLELSRQVDDSALLTRALHYVTRAGLDLCPPALLRDRILEGLAVAERIGDELHTYLHEVLHTIWHIFYGTAEEASAVGWQFVQRHRSSTSPHIAAHVLETGAWLALLAGDADTATSYLDTALTTYAELANPGCSCHALEAFAWWLAVRGEPEAACGVLDAVLAVRARDHQHRAVYESVPYRGVTALVGPPAETESSFERLSTGIELAQHHLEGSLKQFDRS